MGKPDDFSVFVRQKGAYLLVMLRKFRAFPKNFFRVAELDPGVLFAVFPPGSGMKNSFRIHQNVLFFEDVEVFIGNDVTEAAHMEAVAALYVVVDIFHSPFKVRRKVFFRSLSIFFVIISENSGRKSLITPAFRPKKAVALPSAW